MALRLEKAFGISMEASRHAEWRVYANAKVEVDL
jgi:hypothetical protein